MGKKMQNNKKQTKYTIPWSLLSVITKMHVKKMFGQMLMLGQAQIPALLSYYQPAWGLVSTGKVKVKVKKMLEWIFMLRKLGFWLVSGLLLKEKVTLKQQVEKKEWFLREQGRRRGKSRDLFQQSRNLWIVINKWNGGRPGGAAVKLAHSTLAARGSPVQILGADMALLGKPCCGRRPTYKVEEDGHGC